MGTEDVKVTAINTYKYKEELDLVAQSVELRISNPKVVGSIPTLVRVFLCPLCPVPSVGLTLTWFIWDRNIALHVTLHSQALHQGY